LFPFVKKGTFLVTQTICNELVEKKLPGSIVNIGSIVAQRGNKGQCNYAASKAAVEVFSKTVALEMARYIAQYTSFVVRYSKPFRFTVVGTTSDVTLCYLDLRPLQ